jgi:hypothetical protein
MCGAWSNIDYVVFGDLPEELRTLAERHWPQEVLLCDWEDGYRSGKACGALHELAIFELPDSNEQRAVGLVRIGWPMYLCRCVIYSEIDGISPIYHSFAGGIPMDPHMRHIGIVSEKSALRCALALPYWVEWVGFLVDVTCGFVILCTVTTTIRFCRRMWRRHFCQCERCGYPKNPSVAICSECGHSLAKGRRTACRANCFLQKHTAGPL